MHARTWTVDLLLFEDDGRTRATAVLHTDAGTELRHEGSARLNPSDHDVPEIGAELAACRALNGLAHDLLEATIVDIKQNDPSAARVSVRTTDAWS